MREHRTDCDISVLDPLNSHHLCGYYNVQICAHITFPSVSNNSELIKMGWFSSSLFYFSVCAQFNVRTFCTNTRCPFECGFVAFVRCLDSMKAPTMFGEFVLNKKRGINLVSVLLIKNAYIFRWECHVYENNSDIYSSVSDYKSWVKVFRSNLWHYP